MNNMMGKIILSTIHKSKGLEFDHVFLVDINEGILPSKKAQDKEEELEESRVFYVGITRAKKKLYLCCSDQERISRFIKELDSDLIEIETTDSKSIQYEKEKINKPKFETFDDPAYFTLLPPPENPQNIKKNVCKALEAIEKVKVGNNSLEGLTYKEYFRKDYDFLGNAYQFFLQQFAAEGGKQGGQFYTPLDVVELLVKLLQIDKKGAIVYDPCCGSGGMFVKANRLNMDKELVFLGQELIHDTTRLAKRRLIMEGIKSFQIIQGDTLFKDEHSNEKVDFILANPPFNQKDNKMVEGDELEAIITLPNKLFYTTSISPCIWILRKSRKTDEVLMIDISQEDFGEKITKQKKSDKERILTSRDIKKVTQVYQKFLKERKIANYLPSRIVSQKEIEENYYILVPTFYLKAKEIKLTQKEINRKLLSTTEELEKLIEEQDNYHKQLRELLKELKKEIDEETE
ncbi:3958_t:CDS:2 [Ambispora leptoticha]|uniref:site-specific DNA-methyltransferase (adenine-specific) n=1 Tax=Ambispora leptoticha TaxID=144679 RepID=A0A9N8V4X2_9GLOM|nr:3958_t:CDS:2 [Ambispora leptoticha]